MKRLKPRKFRIVFVMEGNYQIQTKTKCFGLLWEEVCTHSTEEFAKQGLMRIEGYRKQSKANFDLWLKEKEALVSSKINPNVIIEREL